MPITAYKPTYITMMKADQGCVPITMYIHTCQWLIEAAQEIITQWGLITPKKIYLSCLSLLQRITDNNIYDNPKPEVEETHTKKRKLSLKYMHYRKVVCL